MRRGFSLVELSIVLVILGLLTGGILAGQSLIRASELRAVTTEYQRWTAAAGSFRDKYFAVPGDMTNATSFWGFAGGTTGTDAACYGSTTGTGTQTCNGNGNGLVALSGAGNQYNESHMFWQQLASAGLIEGNYTGKAGASSGYTVVIGTNAPASKLGRAGWSIHSEAPITGDSLNYDGTQNNILYYGTIAPTFPSSHTMGPAMKASEAWNIDTKMDDGKPSSGSIITYKPMYEWYGCADGMAADAPYALSRTEIACNLIFRRFISVN